jgi:hypothetical protein
LAGAAATVLLGGIGAAFVLGGGAGSDESDLPVLPPVEEREPDAYGADGCADLGDGLPADCGTTADELDGVLAGPPGDEFRTLAGFVGPRWTTERQRNAVLVLEETVRSTEERTWSARGLVRNETAAAVDVVVVEAHLLDAAGSELGVVEASVAVTPLRAGEPAPFAAESEVPVDTIATVEWVVRSQPTEAGEQARAAELVTFWTEPSAERTPPISIADHEDPASGAGPHLVFGSVTGLDGADLDQPTVVAAWLAQDGTVLAAVEADVVPVGGSDALAHLGAGELGDFVLALDAPDTDELATAQLALWAVGS